MAIGKNTYTDLKVGDAVGIKVCLFFPAVQTGFSSCLGSQWIADACLQCSYCRQGQAMLPDCLPAR